MKFVRLERDESLERVAARLNPDASPERIQRTVEALQRANPGLAERAGTGEELVLTVPADVQAERPTKQEGARVDVLLGDVQTRVVQATDVVAEQAAKEEARATEARERLDTGELARLAKERPAMAAQVAEVRKAADSRAREAAAVRELQVAALAHVRTDLLTLARLATEGSPLGAVLDDLAAGTAGAVSGGTGGRPTTGTSGGTTGRVEKPPTGGTEAGGGVRETEGRVTPGIGGGTTSSEKTEATTTTTKTTRPTKTASKTTKRAGGKGKKKGGGK